MSKVWFVTGSSRGLGREIVEAALNAGDRVVATARKPAQLNDLTDKFRDRVLLLALDVTDSAEVAHVVEEGYKVTRLLAATTSLSTMRDTAIRLPSRTPPSRASRSRSQPTSLAWST